MLLVLEIASLLGVVAEDLLDRPSSRPRRPAAVLVPWALM